MAFVEPGLLEFADLDNKSKPSKENYVILIQEDGQERKRHSLPPWEQYAKMFRTVRLQNATGDSSGTVFLTEMS